MESKPNSRLRNVPGAWRRSKVSPDPDVLAEVASQRYVAARLLNFATLHGELTVAATRSRSVGKVSTIFAGAPPLGSRRIPSTATPTRLMRPVRFGSDADARCEASRIKADAAPAKLADRIARLAPWTGRIEELALLPKLDAAEIQAARDTMAELVTDTGCCTTAITATNL